MRTKALTEMKLQINSSSLNEGFARVTVAAFVARLDPTIEELSDLKTAVSEAVTNCSVHAYPDTVGPVFLWVGIYPDRTVHIRIKDHGVGIADVEKAREPMFTTGGEERAGLGFAVMESFTDRLQVRSKVGKGTTVTLVKRLGEPRA